MAGHAKPDKTEKIPYMFKDSFFRADKGTVRKAIAFPLAFLVHASLILAALVIPLLNTTNN